MAATKLRRTWPQRLTFVAVLIAALACFATAAALATGQWVLSQRKFVPAIESPTAAVATPIAGEPVVITPGASTTLPGAPTANQAANIELAEPAAANFLIVGADNGGCGDDDELVVDRGDLGERSDTIMIWRANPEADQLAVLSFPRDLYVDIARGRRARINTAYARNDPRQLIDTIADNFGIPVNHYVQVDFCAFRRLVDAVGGVEIPFEYPSRDRRSGFAAPEGGCVNLDGDTALQYVRSRSFEQENPAGSGDWERDPTSDFGRIARQQDFLRRVVAKVINENLYSPDVASALITTNRDYLVTDAGLTVRRMLEFANTLRRLDPAQLATYRIESSPETLANGDKVERPLIGGDNMQAILAVFRGQARLADAPDQVFDTTATVAASAPDDAATTTSSTVAASVTTTTTPALQTEENAVGLVPDRDATCG